MSDESEPLLDPVYEQHRLEQTRVELASANERVCAKLEVWLEDPTNPLAIERLMHAGRVRRDVVHALKAREERVRQATKPEPIERRAPLQGTPRVIPDGTILWSEHLEIHEAYTKRYSNGQSAERIVARGGFGYDEAEGLLGRSVVTWKPR